MNVLVFDVIPAVRHHFIERAAFILNKSVDDMAAEFANLVAYYGAVTARDTYFKMSRVGARFTMNRAERDTAYDLMQDAIERARIDLNRTNMYTR